MNDKDQKQDKKVASDKEKDQTKKENEVEKKNKSHFSAEAKKAADGACREEMTDEEYITFLETEIGRHISEAQECKNQAQRLQAEFENYRKRNETLAEDMRKIGVSTVVEKMLEVLDNCDRARAYITDANALMGFNLMEQQIVSALSPFGLMDAGVEVGNAFDAKSMHAVERAANAEMADKVVEVLSKGYMLDKRVLRPAKVKVGYAPQPNAEDTAPTDGQSENK